MILVDVLNLIIKMCDSKTRNLFPLLCKEFSRAYYIECIDIIRKNKQLVGEIIYNQMMFRKKIILTDFNSFVKKEKIIESYKYIADTCGINGPICFTIKWNDMPINYVCLPYTKTNIKIFYPNGESEIWPPIHKNHTRRYFKMYYFDPYTNKRSEFQGRFCGEHPSQAAKKALSKIYLFFRNKGKTNIHTDCEIIHFAIKESTRGSSRKIFYYSGKLKELKTPTNMTITDRYTNRQQHIKYRYRSVVKPRDILTNIYCNNVQLIN